MRKRGGVLDALKKEENPQLVLLDIMLPDEDGISILKKLRSYALTADIPVIMATAKGTEYDKVIGLDQGADDYLAKPFGMMEMVSRVKAVLRRTNGQRRENDPSREMEIDEKRHSVTVGGKKINLTLKEYELLRLLMKNPGQSFTRDELLLSGLGFGLPAERPERSMYTSERFARRLERRAARIETVRGVGYRMSDSAKGM
jgi:two-component system alkaline phosphatase synthesis response regulator PhoP